MTSAEAAAAVGRQDADWRQLANCTSYDDALFYDSYGRDGIALAKKICRRCPVARECLTYALEHREPYGIWGGTTPKERFAMLAAKNGPPRGHYYQAIHAIDDGTLPAKDVAAIVGCTPSIVYNYRHRVRPR
jgi:WhiB family redox-sensing transcriptional regulator